MAAGKHSLPAGRLCCYTGVDCDRGICCPVVGHRRTEFSEHWPRVEGPATSSAPEARSSVNRHSALGSPLLSGHNADVGRARYQAAPALRLKICGAPECRAVFAVCVSCDRGQRYSSQSCREQDRWKPQREANRRYQRTERGGRPAGIGNGAIASATLKFGLA